MYMMTCHEAYDHVLIPCPPTGRTLGWLQEEEEVGLYHVLIVLDQSLYCATVQGVGSS